MKRTLVVVSLGVGIAVGLGILLQNETEYTAPPKEIVEIDNTPDWAQDEDAVKAAQDVIRRKALEAQEKELVSEITTLQTELDEVRKELGTY